MTYMAERLIGPWLETTLNLQIRKFYSTENEMPYFINKQYY